MPQLNPAPWFTIFFFTWLFFLVFMVPKILAHKFPNKASMQNTKVPATKPLTWPWQ